MCQICICPIKLSCGMLAMWTNGEQRLFGKAYSKCLFCGKTITGLEHIQILRRFVWLLESGVYLFTKKRNIFFGRSSLHLLVRHGSRGVLNDLKKDIYYDLWKTRREEILWYTLWICPCVDVTHRLHLTKEIRRVLTRWRRIRLSPFYTLPQASWHYISYK